jgi:hypothetical protein
VAAPVEAPGQHPPSTRSDPPPSPLHALPGPAWLTPAAGIAAALGACTYLALTDPSTGGAYPICPTKLATGLDCPLCGGLRGTHDLLRGDVVGAASHNLILVAGIPVVLYGFIAWLATKRRWRWQPRPIRLTGRAWTLIGLLALAYSVVRNLPWGPGPWLFSDPL